MQDVIRMTYDVALCHPDEITKIWSLSHPVDLAIPSISSGWLIVDALCHPDDLPGVGISSGWVTANSLCHPGDILFHFMSSGWLNWGWFLIRMSYGNVIMSSGWDTLPFLSHRDEIANFDFPQHAVALQRFRTIQRSTVIHVVCRLFKILLYIYNLKICSHNRQTIPIVFTDYIYGMGYLAWYAPTKNGREAWHLHPIHHTTGSTGNHR